ncbi:MAG TPA: hypothetical protein VLL04_00760 [Rhizomicrobium sp.]|nr:hypothetical protein [Rhizomicrobium sp.]
MKNRAIILAILAQGFGFALAASAQEQAPAENAPPGVAVESVIVTAPKERPERQLDNFIIAHAAPSPFLRKIARWKDGICPVTIGLPAKFDLYVTQRIVRVAMAAGAPLDPREPCRPNIAVVATPQPQELLDLVRTKRPVLLGFHYVSQAKKVAAMSRAVQAWYSTATEDFYGFVQPDGGGYNLNTEDARLAGGMTAHVSGMRTGDGLKSQFTTAIIIVDSAKIAGQPIGPLADYIAMLALAQGQYYDVCQNVPTITNLLAPDCAEGMRPAALTDIDVTYLRGLYKMAPGGSYIGERGSIAFAMKKELGGY